MDALRATFPAGTVSGVPMAHAMEIIDEPGPGTQNKSKASLRAAEMVESRRDTRID